MACVLYFLVSMAALKLSHTYNARLPPYWGWYRQYDINPSFEVTASSYRFPLTSQTLHVAPIHEVYSIEETDRPIIDCCRVNTRISQDTRDYRVNERSIANSHLQNVQNVPYVRINEPMQRRSENGSSKILNSFLKPARRRGQIDNHPITFPGPTESSFRSGYVPEIPESCRNSTYCEDVPNYPQDEIDKYILELGDTVQFQLDKLDVSDTPDINQRVGPFEDNVELCHYEEKVVYPKTAQGADGKWYSLLNRKDNPVQGYRVEICNFSGGTGCANIAIFQQGYEASCKQKYVYRTAAAFEKVGDGIRTFETEVKLPSCCSCSAKLSLR